jgi:hypothetical protein
MPEKMRSVLKKAQPHLLFRREGAWLSRWPPTTRNTRTALPAFAERNLPTGTFVEYVRMHLARGSGHSVCLA